MFQVCKRVSSFPFSLLLHVFRFAKEHNGEYDWVRKNEGHKGVQVGSTRLRHPLPDAPYPLLAP